MASARTILLILTFAVAIMMASPSVAGNLVFPKQGAAAKDVIVKDCPTCMASGVTLCGTADVQFGKRLGASYFFAGQPKRGYLPGFRLSGQEFRALARSMPYDAMMQSLKQSFDESPAGGHQFRLCRHARAGDAEVGRDRVSAGAPSMRQRPEQALGLLHRRRL